MGGCWGGGRGSALGGRAGLKLRRQPRPRTGTRWALRPYTNTAAPEIAGIGAVGTGNPPGSPRTGGIVLTARFKMVTLTIKSQQQSTCPRPEHKKTPQMTNEKDFYARSTQINPYRSKACLCVRNTKDLLLVKAQRDMISSHGGEKMGVVVCLVLYLNIFHMTSFKRKKQ